MENCGGMPEFFTEQQVKMRQELLTASAAQR